MLFKRWLKKHLPLRNSEWCGIVINRIMHRGGGVSHVTRLGEEGFSRQRMHRGIKH
jgi:hypothetical protein